MALPTGFFKSGGRVLNEDGTELNGPVTTKSVGYQQLTALAANQTLASLCSGAAIPSGATKVLIVPSAAIRVRDDGGAPTAAVGLPVAAGQPFTYDGDAISALRVYGAATLDCWFYA